MSTNREPAPTVFGRTATAAARAAFWLALLGVAMVLALVRLLARPGSPFGALLAPVAPALAALGVLAVLALAAWGYRQSLRSAERFRVTERGLEVEGPFGAYCLEWTNLREAGVAPGGALGLRVRSREAVVATHRGTERQREWLRTMEPFGEWDFLYPRADLGAPVERVLAALEPHLRRRMPGSDAPAADPPSEKANRSPAS